MFLHQGPPEVVEEEEKKEGEEEGKEEGEGEGEGKGGEGEGKEGEEEEEEGEVADLDILLRRERAREKRRKDGPQVGVKYLFANCTQMYPQDLSLSFNQQVDQLMSASLLPLSPPLSPPHRQRRRKNRRQTVISSLPTRLTSNTLMTTSRYTVPSLPTPHYCQ